jgi:phosphatidylglycerol:prolipoprotein diacylglycerol transferase
MIPYCTEPKLEIGPYTLYAFGILLACALAVGSILFIYVAERSGLSVRKAVLISLIGLPVGLLGAHLWYCATENESALLEFGGITSYGGIFAAFAVLCVVVLSSQPRSVKEFEKWIDAAFVAFSVTAMVSRLGCFLAHDHRGSLTSSWLGVKFPDGARYDLGLLECVFWGLVCVLILVLRKCKISTQNGVISSSTAIAYGFFRLWADAKAEPLDTAGGFVKSQHFGLLLIVLGLVLGFRSNIRNFDGIMRTQR